MAPHREEFKRYDEEEEEESDELVIELEMNHVDEEVNETPERNDSDDNDTDDSADIESDPDDDSEYEPDNNSDDDWAASGAESETDSIKSLSAGREKTDEDDLIKIIKKAKSIKKQQPPDLVNEDNVTSISFSPANDIIAVGTIEGDICL